MNTCRARHARSRVSSLALCLGLSLALGTSATVPASAQAPAANAAPATKAAPAAGKPGANPLPTKSSTPNGAEDEDDDEKDDDKDDKAKGASPEERAARRRERLEQGAKRLRERAADLRKRIAAGETAPPQPPNSKRPARSLEEQAERFERQAARMDERAKNVSAENIGPSGGGAERSPEYARQRRHQLRRAHLNRRWGGPTLRDPEAAAELKLHAERVARLKRIRSLAMEKSKDDPVAKRAKELLNKEDDRHEDRMKAIQARVAPPATAPAAEGTPATTAPAATEATK